MRSEIVFAIVCGKGNDDPLRKGRIQCMPMDLFGATMNMEDAPWAIPEDSGSGFGSTKHVGILKGQVLKCRRYDDGTMEYISRVLTDPGAHAPVGGTQIESKGSNYPSVAPSSKA